MINNIHYGLGFEPLTLPCNSHICKINVGLRVSPCEYVVDVHIGRITLNGDVRPKHSKFFFYQLGLSYLPLVGWTTVGELVKGV